MEASEAVEHDSGLRARHKARTRLAISDAATQLFIQRGFEQVTVAEVAAAADVSVKTVFNYFPSKEDLFFDRADAVIGAIAEAVRARPAGTSVLTALHTLFAERLFPFDDGWSGLRVGERYERLRAFIATEQASPALRARRLVIVHGWGDDLRELFAAELGVGDIVARTLAGLVIGAMSLREQVLSSAMSDGASAREVERRVREVVGEAFARLERGFADVDR